MLAEYDHFSSCVKRNIVLKIHIDRIVYTESPNLRSFRQRLIMDCIKKRDLVCFCWFILIEQIYKDTVFNSLFSFPAIGSPFMCMNKSCSTGGKILLSLLFSNLLLLSLLSSKVFLWKRNFFSFLRPSLKNQYTKKELFYKAIHAKTVVVLYRVILREFLRPAKLPVSFTERISVNRFITTSFTFLTKFRLTSGIPIRGVLRSPPLLC